MELLDWLVYDNPPSSITNISEAILIFSDIIRNPFFEEEDHDNKEELRTFKDSSEYHRLQQGYNRILTEIKLRSLHLYGKKRLHPWEKIISDALRFNKKNMSENIIEQLNELHEINIETIDTLDDVILPANHITAPEKIEASDFDDLSELYNFLVKHYEPKISFICNDISLPLNSGRKIMAFEEAKNLALPHAYWHYINIQVKLDEVFKTFEQIRLSYNKIKRRKHRKVKNTDKPNLKQFVFDAAKRMVELHPTWGRHQIAKVIAAALKTEKEIDVKDSTVRRYITSGTTLKKRGRPKK